jgi:predicted MPP superfamily phosphohydrolase
VKQDIGERLEQRLGRLHARLRLGIEADHEAQVFGQGITYFHIENLPRSHAAIRACLKLVGLYGRGRRNAEEIELRQHDVISSRIPETFDGFSILQLSDLHVEMSEGALKRLAAMLPNIDYDLCVLTGDYRALTYGAYEPAVAGMTRLCSVLKKPAYGVLGNHDTIRMVPELEDMGVQMLLNENHAIERGNQQIYLAGIDDAHFYGVDNIEKAATGIPSGVFSILLSHTPEVYQQASYADFSLLLSGHTHGGQICLPGRIPIALQSVLPRQMGSGAWKYHDMIGYTSVGVGTSIVPVRLNCPPEITIHRLRLP